MSKSLSSSSASPTLLLSGALMLLKGMLLGLAIHALPYPRLALAAHRQFTTEGIMTMVAGLIVEKIDVKYATVVVYGHLGLWLQCSSELVAAFLGSFDTLTMATNEAGVPVEAKNESAELFIVLMHAIPGTLLIVSWAILSWSLYQHLRSGGDKVKTT